MDGKSLSRCCEPVAWQAGAEWEKKWGRVAVREWARRESEAGPSADQQKKHDAGKPLLFCVPTELVRAVGEVMTFGAGKYGRDTWRGVEADRYQQAMARHFEAYKADPDGVDEESGLPHLWHLACNVAFLCALAGREYATRP